MSATALAAALIPPSMDAKQALRLRRLGLASLSYVLAAALTTVGGLFGMLSPSTVPAIVAAFAVLNLGLYAAIRSGFNLRFRDPSLTRFQMLAAITVLMCVVYRMEDGRNIALFACFMIFLFGLFRLNAREFVMITLYALAAYALVINLLMHFRPDTIRDVSREWLSWLGLAVFLPCFSMISEQINTLRLRMRESEARFRSLTEMSSDFYWKTDATHRFSERVGAGMNTASATVLWRGAQLGERRWEVPSLSPDETGWAMHRADLAARRPIRGFEFSRPAPDGSERHISISGDPLFDAAGVFTGYRGVGTDITARKMAERAVRDTEQELRIFADNVPAMTVSWDANLRCHFANKAYIEFFAPTMENVVGKHVQDVVGGKVYHEVEGHFREALEGFPVNYQRIHLHWSGEHRHLETRLLPNLDDKGKVLGFFSVISDITEHKLTEERIQRLAHHDSLTGLPNRLLFNDRLGQAIALRKRDSRTLALLYVDLDRFKAVNDALGHAAGDELLKGAAMRIRRQVRDSDTVARVGGDEFIVILSDVGRREVAEIVARKITAALEEPFFVGDPIQSVRIGSSIGIAAYPADALDADSLVTVADAAMFRAKQALPELALAS